MSDVVIGVDGGGTRTRAVAIDDQGSELGREEGPPALVDPLDPSGAADAVETTVHALASGAGLTLPVRSLWAGLAGAGREAPRRAVERELAGRGLAAIVGVGTDVAAAAEDALGDGPGLLLVAGTGSIAWGRDATGRDQRVGGWGALLGDEGSAYRIGLEALRRATRMADGRERRTDLLARLLGTLDLADASELPAWASAASKRDVAALAELVVLAAADGIAAADDVLADALDALEGHVVALRDALGPWDDPPPVALAGGLLDRDGPLREALARRLRRRGLTVTDRVIDAGRGAALRALRAARSTSGPC